MTMPSIFKWPADRALPPDFLAKMDSMRTSKRVIIYPTSTLYGLGASIYSSDAVSEVFTLKSRPPGNPVPLMASASQLKEICTVPEIFRPFMDSGDNRVTAILMAAESAPPELVHCGTLAVRLPCSALTESLVNRVGPITSTSANIHGQATPPDIGSLASVFGERIYVYIDSGRIHGPPTSLIDFTGASPKIIREGALSLNEMERIYER